MRSWCDVGTAALCYFTASLDADTEVSFCRCARVFCAVRYCRACSRSIEMTMVMLLDAFFPEGTDTR